MISREAVNFEFLRSKYYGAEFVNISLRQFRNPRNLQN